MMMGEEGTAVGDRGQHDDGDGDDDGEEKKSISQSASCQFVRLNEAVLFSTVSDTAFCHHPSHKHQCPQGAARTDSRRQEAGAGKAIHVER